MQRNPYRGLRVVILIGLLAVLLAACTPPASPVPATPAAVEIPTVTVEITADGISVPAEVPSGVVSFVMQNTSGADGSPEIVRLNDGVTVDQLNEALASGDDMAALALVSLQGAPSASVDNKVTYNLTPGNYVAALFPENGPPVVQSFTSGADSGAAAPSADVSAQLVDFQFLIPDEIKAGPQVWQIENKGDQWHEMGILKFNEGATMDDLMAMLQSEESSGPPPFEDVAFWSPMGPGQTAWVTWDLPAGEYTVVCFLPDLNGDGAPHLAHGMTRTLTVTE